MRGGSEPSRSASGPCPPGALCRRLALLHRGSKVGCSPPPVEGGVSAREAPSGLRACPVAPHRARPPPRWRSFANARLPRGPGGGLAAGEVGGASPVPWGGGE